MERPPFIRIPRNRPEPAPWVMVGSPSEGELKRGDTLLRISNRDTAKMSHNDAQMLFKNAGNSIDLTVRRDAPGTFMTYDNSLAHSPTPHNNLTAAVQNAARYNATVAANHHQQQYQQQQPYSSSTLPHSLPSHKIPYYGAGRSYNVPELPRTDFAQHTAAAYAISNGAYEKTVEKWEKEKERQAIVNQPHRTFPLIQPSLKTKKDLPTGSYLRHVNDPFGKYPSSGASPIPGMRNEQMMKQMVHDSILTAGVTGPRPMTPTNFNACVTPDGKSQIVHSQYNSPINLYSTQNVASTLQNQTGMSLHPPGGPQSNVVPEVKPFSGLPTPYNPSKSPTCQAIYEDEWGDLNKRNLREQAALAERIKVIPTSSPDGRRPRPDSKVIQGPSFEYLSQHLYGHTDF